MNALLRSELRKLTTTKLWWGMLLGALAFAALSVAAQIATNGTPGSPIPSLKSAETQRAIAASANAGYLFAIIVGIILITTEFRQFTSRPTFLLSPQRGRVIGAKMTVAAVLGLGYGAASAALTAAIMIPWFASKHVTIGWIDHDVLLVLVRCTTVVVIYAVVGVGIGSILRNQVAAVVAMLAYLLVVEPLIVLVPFLKEAYRYLPGAAATAMTSGHTSAGPPLLAAWQGASVLLLWALILAGMGWVLMIRRDVE